MHAWCTCSPFAGQITDLRARVSELEAGKGGEARELSDRLNAAVDDAAAKAAALRTALADTAEARRELEAARAEVTEMNAGTWCVCPCLPLSWLRIPFQSWMCGLWQTIRIPTTTPHPELPRRCCLFSACLGEVARSVAALCSESCAPWWVPTQRTLWSFKRVQRCSRAFGTREPQRWRRRGGRLPLPSPTETH